MTPAVEGMKLVEEKLASRKALAEANYRTMLPFCLTAAFPA
jgi:hypothetical protein